MTAAHIEDWSDERNLGHGIIVTLVPGLSFEPNEHLGVKGFDTVTEARRESRLKHVFPCAPDCEECESYRTTDQGNSARSTRSTTMTDTTKGFQTIDIDQIIAWPKLNPRTSFDEVALQELAESIRSDGLLEPVLAAPAGLVKKGVRFWLFAGERRLRASKLAGKKTIEVIVHDVDEATAHRLAGIENLDRNDLTAIEEATWLRREMELTGLAQKGLGETLGRSQAWVANRIRLLELPAGIQNLVQEGTIAPAMVRDHLLRFLKLSKEIKVLPVIAKRIRKAAGKDGGTVERADILEAVWRSLHEVKAEVIRLGHVDFREGRHYRYLNVTEDSMARFKSSIGEGLCVQAPTQYGHGQEEVYTFATKAWRAFLVEEYAAQEKRRAERVDTSPDYAEKIKNAKLGIDKKPRTVSALETSFGWNNVFPMADLGDLEGVTADQVIPATVARWEGGEQVKTLELVYVGTDAHKRENAKRNRQGEEVVQSTKRAHRKTVKATASTTADAGLRGLLDVMLRSYDLAMTTVQLLKALGRDVPSKWGHAPYNGTVDQIEPPLTAAEVRQLAGAIAVEYNDPAQADAYEARGKRSLAATAKVEKQRAKELTAWTAEHAPDFNQGDK